jgi:[ribosomal protein S5]-alanine N-acetyltransferase
MNTLHTPRLLLEPQTAAHAPEMYTLLCDPAIYQHENAPPPSEPWLAQRYARLESRRSPDGREQWLNWVVRQRSDDRLIGYVQATAQADGMALVAYEFASAHWGQGLAGEAVRAMLVDLAAEARVTRALAQLKRSNTRSMALLRRLGFVAAAPDDPGRVALPPDEQLMTRPLPG